MTVTLDLLFPHLDDLIQTPADVQRLNEAILQLAVQGKLVPQDLQDEPASELLKRIDLERNRLVSDGLVDKIRKLSPVGEAAFAFALPSGWSLVRLGELVSKLGAGSTPLGGKAVYQDQGIKFIRSQNVWNDGLHLDDVAFISEEINERMANTIVKPKDILLNITGASIGRSAIVPDDFDLANVSQHVAIVRLIQPELRQFLHICIVSPYTQNLITDAEVGISREGLSMSNLQHFVIPLPPLAEQKRIVAKVDELLAQTRALEAKLRRAQEAIVVVNRAVLHHLHHAADHATFQHAAQILGDHFDLLYTAPRPVTDLRQTILQLAVQGKLVPQDPHDEPAGALLKRVEKEKARLVAEGKLKKERALPPISDDEAPFSLPSGWAWTRLPEIGELARGQSKHRPRNDLMLYEDGIYPFIQTGDVARAEGKIFTYSAKYNDIGLAQSRLWPPGTLCITIAANIAETAILGIEACFPDSIVGFVPFSPINEADYFQIFMKVAKSRLEEYAPSTAQKNINLGILGELLVPLPPLNEIRRIVAKVDELLARCAALEHKLGQAQVAGRQLTAAVLHGAVG